MVNGKLECLPLDQCSVEENSPCKASCLENDRHCNGDNALPLDPVCRFSASSIHLQNGEVDESSVSTGIDMSPLCRTPPERKSDPFSARSGDLVLTPKGSYVPHWPTLNYDLGCDSEENVGTGSTELDAEENFSKLIFSSLLELIISTKLMEMSVNNRAADSDRAAECKTPTHLPLLKGIAETCPPAPLRRTLFVKGFDLSICRKLDFEDCLD